MRHLALDEAPFDGFTELSEELESPTQALRLESGFVTRVAPGEISAQASRE